VRVHNARSRGRAVKQKAIARPLGGVSSLIVLARTLLGGRIVVSAL
jgi:hypothetical protein